MRLAAIIKASVRDGGDRRRFVGRNIGPNVGRRDGIVQTVVGVMGALLIECRKGWLSVLLH
jgi:hypothetical protein